MKKLLLPFFLFIQTNAFCQEKFQLAPPFLKYKSIFFDKKTTLEILFNQPGAEIRYTLNGKEPTEKDFIYTKPIAITGRKVIVKAKAIGKGFDDSDITSVNFYTQGKSIKQILFSPPDPKYEGSGENTLHDNMGGLMNLRSGTWLGYDQDSVEVNIELKKKETVASVLIDILIDEGSWIFLPEKVLLYYYDYNQNVFLPAGKEVFFSIEPTPKQCSAQIIFPKQKVKTAKLKLVMYPLKKIPDWHPGKGNHAWLFIDEVKVY